MSATPRSNATLPSLSEREFMEQVTQLAEIRGWSWAHFRPAQTSKGWRTPVSGPLGKGWPDLVLVKPAITGQTHTWVGRVMFVELKRDGAWLTADQDYVWSVFQLAGADFRCWRPMDWDEIEAALR